ncbi:MAG: putative sulfate exporter family transporter [Bacillaceae bacterium]|nr:putative sulfate exporter family transporter [Bacillaceae bacterium]
MDDSSLGRMNDFIQKTRLIIPGLLFCFILMFLAIFLADWLGKWIIQLQGLPNTSSSPISSIFISIILGLLVRNILGLHAVFKDGVAFSIKFILRFGIILLGIRLSFTDVIKLGAWGIPIILACVAGGLLLTLWITNKLQQSYRLGTLIACGTGICGVTAIVAVAPGIKANDEEMAYAIANITLFGVVAMFVYPYLAHFLFQGDAIKAGLFLGTSIHETAQVAGAALIYDQVYNMSKVVDVATITKLTRNVLIIAVVPILSYFYMMKMKETDDGITVVKRWYQLIPLFVVGFLLMAIIRSIGDANVADSGKAFGLLNPGQWVNTWTTLNMLGSKYLLGIAMVGVGLSTSFSVFKGLGLKPFIIGLIAAFSVGVISLVMVTILGGFIVF